MERDIDKLTEVIILIKASYLSNSGKTKGYSESIEVVFSEKPDELKALANQKFKGSSAEMFVLSTLGAFSGYSRYHETGRTEVRLRELSLQTVAIDELTEQQLAAHRKAKESCLLTLNDAIQKEKEAEELKKAFDAMPDNLKQAISCTVDRLQDNGDYTKYTYTELALVLGSYLGICKIKWTDDYNSRPKLEEGMEFGTFQNKRRVIFIMKRKQIAEVILPEIDIDNKYFFEYTPYDFLGTKIIL